MWSACSSQGSPRISASGLDSAGRAQGRLRTYVVEDACRGIDTQGSLARLGTKGAKAGVKRIQSADIAGLAEIRSTGDRKGDRAPSPACGGGVAAYGRRPRLRTPMRSIGYGWGRRRESYCPCGESFPHPHRILRCDATSPQAER